MNNTLYIIGNGFDLHHGLKTSYVDFRENYVKKHLNFQRRLNEAYGDELDKDMWWWNFEEMLGRVDYQHLMNSPNGEALGASKVKNLLRNNIPSSFGHWLQTISDNAKPSESIHIDEDAQFFTFNYTLLLEKIYHVKADHVWHIHKSLNEYELGENPIVGHDSAFGKLVLQSDDYRKDHQNIRIDLVDQIDREIADGAKKVQTRIQLCEVRFYELYAGIEHYIAMGFSFNDIDMPYIEELMKVNSNIQDADWTVYWHSDGEDAVMIEKLKSVGIKGDKINTFHW